MDPATHDLWPAQRGVSPIDEVGFLNSALVQDAVIRNIEIIGEASNNIQHADPEFVAGHGDIPWEVMFAMRNRVSYGYDTVDLEIVWKTIQRDIPNLDAQIRAVQVGLTGDENR
jgi:uncharacterized protein with HEPN domain